jgi:hypothetical protein
MLCEIKTVFSGGYLREKGVHAGLAFSSIYGLWFSLVERLVREEILPPSITRVSQLNRRG